MREVLVALAASALALWVGASLAQGDYFTAGLTAGAAVWAVFSWIRGPRTEAWVLGFLIFGYIVGNRGFAQATPVPGLPVFFGELGLAFCGTLLVLRGALRRELPLARDPLNLLLLAWLALSAGRMLWDLPRHGMPALRDFATVYYAVFFFIAQALVQHAPSRRVLRLALGATLVIAPITGLLWQIFPDFFLQNLIVEGVPLIFYKGDLLATYLYAGFVWLVPKDGEGGRRAAARWVLALACLAMATSLLSRAGLLGLAVAVGWLVLARRWLPLKVLAASAVAAVLALAVYSLVEKRDFTQTKLYGLYEHLVSMVDVSGTGTYRNRESLDVGDNNRFRLVWWRNVAEETLRDGPVLGLGFGHDLASGFIHEYYPVMDAEFTTRSPHNVLVTILGRTGLVGLAVFLGWMAVLAQATLREARLWRTDAARGETATLYAASWVVLVSACFGVVLEGPMGAIPFWIIVGWAHGRRQRLDAEAREVAASANESLPAEARPV